MTHFQELAGGGLRVVDEADPAGGEIGGTEPAPHAARALPRGHDAERFEHAEGLADALPSHLQHGAEFGLGGQRVADLQPGALQVLSQTSSERV